MKHLFLTKAILALIVSTTLPNIPKYCSIHKTMDLCYLETAGKDSGLGDIKH